MFFDAVGDTLYYIRRQDGHDTLFAHQPNHARGDYHALLQATPGRLNAWPLQASVATCDGWPRVNGQSLAFRFLPLAGLRDALKRAPRHVNEHLTGVQTLGQFTAEPRPLPPAVFDLLAGETLRVCGFAPGPQGGMAPALYVMDGRAAVYHAVPLPFLETTTIPSAIFSEPASGRHWLTVGDSNHLFVLDERYQLVGDVFWPAEEQGLARVAFAAARNEAWVSAHSSVFVFDLKSLKLLGEIAAEPNLRWHCGARVRGFVGGLAFNATSTRALLARPLSGDVLEFDAASRRQVGAYPMTVDPLELACAHGKGRVYVQGLRSGAISWFTCHDI